MSQDVQVDSFIKSLSKIYPQPLPSNPPNINPWSWLTAVAFSALNRAEYASKVFEHAVQELSAHEDKLLLARKIRDSLFKAGVIYGYPKTINALIQLDTVMPDDLKEKSALRDTHVSLSELEQRGQAYFEHGYGTTAESVKSLIHNSYPDLGFFTIALAYGFVYSYSDTLNKYETSYTMIAALIPFELQRQTGWHFHSAIRNGATIEQVKAVREIVVKVSEFCGKKWENPVPEVTVPAE